MPPSTEQQPQLKLSDQIAQLAGDLAALRAKFDRYFHDLEKKCPSNDIDSFRKRMLALKAEAHHNTALKFRIQGIIQKFQTYERLWQKTIREIEEGTCKRDLLRLKRKKNKHSGQSDPADSNKNASKSKKDLEVDVDVDLNGFCSPSQARSSDSPCANCIKPNAHPSPLPPSPPVFLSSENFSVTPKMISNIYHKYLIARQLCNESTAGITVEKVAQNIQKQLPQILKNKQATSISFEVTIHKGKAYIKAVTN